MARKRPDGGGDHACEIEIEPLRAALGSPDAAVRAKAVRSICPCHTGWEPFELVLGLLEGLKKDPDPVVRAGALHVFQDAAEMESSGPPTTRQMVKNSMAATKFRMRGFGDDKEVR